MVIHYFTLLALLEELAPRFIGAEIVEAYTQEKSELLLTCSSPGKSATETLCISVEPKANHLFARRDFRRAKRNSSDLFASLIGATIGGVHVVPFDRVVVIELSASRKLVFQLFNSAASNVLLVDGNDLIAEAFKNDKDLHGTRLMFPMPPFDGRLLADPALLLETLEREPHRSVLAALKSAIPIIGTVYAREILLRGEIDGAATVASCSQRERESLAREIAPFFDLLRHPSPIVYSLEKGESVFSLIPLRSLAGAAAKPYASVNEALLQMAIRSYRGSSVGDERDRLTERIRAELQKSERAQQMILADLQDGNRAGEYAALGRILWQTSRSLQRA